MSFLCGFVILIITECSLRFLAKVMCGFLVFGLVLVLPFFLRLENTEGFFWPRINAKTLPMSSVSSVSKSTNAFLDQNPKNKVT